MREINISLPKAVIAGYAAKPNLKLGYGYFADTVKELPKGAPTGSEIPVQRMVRLHHKRTGIMVAQTWSDPVTGAYRFDWIDHTQTYYVASFDHNGVFQAIVADCITPVLYSQGG